MIKQYRPADDDDRIRMRGLSELFDETSIAHRLTVAQFPFGCLADAGPTR